MRLPRKNEIYAGIFLLWAFLVSIAIVVLLDSPTSSDAQAMLAAEREQMKPIAEQLGVMQARMDRVEVLLERMLSNSTISGVEGRDTSDSETDEQIKIFKQAYIAVRPGWDDFSEVTVQQLEDAMHQTKVAMKSGPNSISIENEGNGQFKMTVDLVKKNEWHWLMQNDRVAILTEICGEDGCSSNFQVKWAIVKSLLDNGHK